MIMILRLINGLLRLTPWAVLPRHSVKMLHEYANVVETHHPGRTGAARWLRRVAEMQQ